MDHKYYLPQHLDEPFRVYLLTLDELSVLIVPIVAGFVFNQMVIGFCLGITLIIGLKKIKGEQGHYYLMHLMYWYFPDLVKFRVTPPSHVRRYLG